MFESLAFCLLLAPQEPASPTVTHEGLTVYAAPILAVAADAAGEALYTIVAVSPIKPELHAFAVKKRQPLWKAELSGPVDKVSVGKDLVVVADGQGPLVTFAYYDRETGKLGSRQRAALLNQGATAAVCDPRDRWVWLGTDRGMMTRLFPGDARKFNNRAMKNDGVMAVALDPKAKMLAVGGKDGSVRFVNPVSAQTDDDKVFTGHSQSVTALAWDTRGQLLVAGDASGKLIVHTYANGRSKCVFEEHAAAICSIAIHPKNAWVATADVKGVVCLWNLTKGTRLARIEVPDTKDGPVGMVLLDGGKRLVTAGGTSLIDWDVSAIKP